MAWNRYALLLLFGFQSRAVPVSYSQDKCSLEGCVVEVSTTKPILRKEGQQEKYRTSVYFGEDLFVATPAIRSKVKSFIGTHRNEGTFVVTGHTDGCGAHQYNRVLSRDRALSVARIIRLTHPGASVRLRWEGEASTEHSTAARRVDVVVSKNNKHVKVPPKLIADYYLIDGSGSMSGGKWNKWLESISYWRPKGSRVFVGTTKYVRKGTNIQSIYPEGGTHIWLAYWTILSYMKAGETLVIISDFNSDAPLTGSEASRIEQRVKQTGARVTFVRP